MWTILKWIFLFVLFALILCVVLFLIYTYLNPKPCEECVKRKKQEQLQKATQNVTAQYVQEEDI